MQTLHWIGKEKVVNHHLDVPFRVLQHGYGFHAGQGLGAEIGKQCASLTGSVYCNMIVLENSNAEYAYHLNNPMVLLA
jgi:hypothetical protein